MKQKFELKTVWLLFCLFVNLYAHAQHTGSYDTVVAVASGTRAAAVYVPPTYSPATSYRLFICLHGLGDTCNNYRNALVSSLAWPTHFPNTIIVCPEATNRNADYYTPLGGEAVIQAAIDMAKAVYNIDTNQIVLQGFSLGGRAALRYGLEHPNVFQALVLNTPAIQGVKEALNEGSYPFNYSTASATPIYITHGESDVIYTGPIDSMYRQLILNDALCHLNRVVGLGHSIPAFSQMADVHTWANTPAHPGADAHVVAVGTAKRTCAATQTAAVLVRNVGETDIHDIQFSAVGAGAPFTFSWSGTLLPFQHRWIPLPALAATAGTHTLTVTITTLNSVVADTVTSNNSAKAPFSVVTSGAPLTVAEGFEDPDFPSGEWLRHTSGDVYCAWDRDNTVRKTGVASMSSFNSILMFENSGRVDEMESPLMDFSTVTNPRLSFDVAYNYHRYTPPLLTVDTSFADTLSIMVSADCGLTFTTIYKKGGAVLATFPAPILNATSIPAAFISPSAANWRNEDIDLTAYAGTGSVAIKFSYKSALGGSINIDNVLIRDATSVAGANSQEDFVVFPNPTHGILNIESDRKEVIGLSIIDHLGREVYKKNYDMARALVNEDVSFLASGTYFVRLMCGEKLVVRKFQRD